MRRFVPALFYWRGMHFDPGIKVLSQIAVGFRCPLMFCGDSARQNVAEPEPCGPAPSTMASRLLGSLSGLIRSRLVERALTSFRHILRRRPARRRSSGSVRQPAVANRRRTISQPHRSVRAPLKVSSCTLLTQSRNSGNNLQLSEKSFRESEISTSRIQATPSNGARRRIITRPHHFKLAPLG